MRTGGRRIQTSLRAARLLSFAAAALLAGCREAPSNAAALVDGGDPARGARLIADYGCGTCHVVPGVRGATGLAGPSLALIGERAYIAGMLPNTPENLMRWILAPDSIQPGTAMPDVGMDVADARDVAAYLHTLQDGLGPPHLLPKSWVEAP